MSAETVGQAVEQVTAIEELGAMQSAYQALKKLNPAEFYRAMNWLRDRLNADHATSSDEESF